MDHDPSFESDDSTERHEKTGSGCRHLRRYKLATTGLGNAADLAALVCGLVGGIVVARDVSERTPQIRRLATAMATVVTVVTLYAVTAVHRPPTETVDVRPEIDRVIAVEESHGSSL